MKYKKIMILTIILAFLIAISAVSAAENVTDDVVGVEETTDQVVSVESNQVILGNESDVGTFDELSSLIENTSEGKTLELDKDYKYVSGSNEGISINKVITIDGKGHTLDGNLLSRIFFINEDNVMLKDINFVKGFPGLGAASGDAIYWNGANGVLANCSFENCSASNSGSTVDWGGLNGVLANCSFKNSFSVQCDGGAIYWHGDNGVLANCSFENSTSRYKYVGGGAVSWRGVNGVLANCSFVNSYAKKQGGAINVDGDGTVLVNCSFMNSSSDDCGGAISWRSENGVLTNCSFYNNFAKTGNVIYWDGENGLINCSYFSPNFNSIYYGSSDLKIIKMPSAISCENISFEYENYVNLSAHLNTYGELIFNIFNEYDNIIFFVTTTNDGIAILSDELNNLNVGIWNVTVLFEGDDNYAPCNATTTITVLPLNTSLTIDDVNATVGHEVTLIANVNSTSTVNEGIVTFFEGETNIGDANVVDGVATLTYTPTTAGEHSINAVFNSENYQSSNATGVLSVAKANVDLNIKNIGEVYFSTPSNFAVSVNSNSRNVNEGEVKFYVNNVLVGSSEVRDGIAEFNYITNATGSFILTVTYNGTDNYLPANIEGGFQVNKMPTTLTGESVIFDEEAYKTFTTELKDDNNNGVNGKPVKIEVIKYSGESATFNGISDSNGITVYDVGRLAGGMWYVTGIYAGDKNYIKSSFVDKFIVVKMNTTTDIEEISNPKINHNYKLKANIHDEDGKLVKEGIVQFYLNGVDIGSIDLSNNQGHQSALGEGVLGASDSMFEYELGAENDVYLNYVPTKAGKHTLTAVYEGTTLYRSSNSTTILDVSNSNKNGVTITAPIVNTVYNGGKYLVITLKDAVSGKAISSAKVKVVLNGKTSTPTTNKKGQVKVSANGLAPKNYTAKITFAGNTKYDKLSDSTKIIVTKATPKITAKAKTFKKADKTKKYTVTLKNNRKLIKGVTVKITVNKKTYSAKTSSKGVATFKLTKLTKKGKFTATVKSVANKYYNAKTLKNVKITVK